MSGAPCPICRVPMTDVVCHTVTVQLCDQCSGLWLGRDAIDRIQSLSDEDFVRLENLQHDRDGAPREPIVGRMCPDDLRPLRIEEHPFFAHVQVDVCEACGGVWVDHSEVDLIAQTVAEHHHRNPPPHGPAEVAKQQAAIMEVGHIAEMDHLHKVTDVFNVLRHRFLWPGL